ncbi:Clp protease N-terminal domain-containing protein [Dactylosporangium sp. CA-092794]|uniref:Clp protease N-terminal domain-containing protein n=1 Tax=Dactylosporangium sp. CA-092794 TaxID=3239929 RepID=UPI003D8ABFAE
MGSRCVLASLEVVVGLAEAASRAWRRQDGLISAECVAGVLLERLGAERVRWEAAPGFGASGEGVPDEVEDEVEATVRQASWTARRWLHQDGYVPGPMWDQRVRVAVGRALAAAEAGPEIRYLGFKLFLRALLAECASPGEWMEFVRRFHLRPDAEFLADGTPDAAVSLAMLRTFKVVDGGEAGGLAALAARSLVRAERGRDDGPMVPVLRAEATRQAVRGGCALVGQAHLVMAVCAVDFALAQTGSRLNAAAAPVNAAAGVLAELGISYPVIKDFAEDLAAVPGDPPPGERSWRQDRADPPWGADLVQAFTEAKRLAVDLGHRFPGTSHVLYAVAADGAGTGARMLRAYGVDPAALAVRLGRQLAP